MKNLFNYVLKAKENLGRVPLHALRCLVVVILTVINIGQLQAYTVNIHNTLTGCSQKAGNPTSFDSGRTTVLSLYYTISSGYDPSWSSTYEVKSGTNGSNLALVNKCRWHDDDGNGEYQLDIYFNDHITINSSDFYITIGLDMLGAYEIDYSTSGCTGSVEGPASALPGATVNMTVTPGDGCELSTIYALDGDADEITVTGSGTSWHFTMPNSKVTLEVQFTAAASTHSITYDRTKAACAQDGSGSWPANVSSVADGASYNSLPTDIELNGVDGYTFVGWTTESSTYDHGTSTLYTTSIASVTSDMTLYPVFSSGSSTGSSTTFSRITSTDVTAGYYIISNGQGGDNVVGGTITNDKLGNISISGGNGTSIPATDRLAMWQFEASGSSGNITYWTIKNRYTGQYMALSHSGSTINQNKIAMQAAVDNYAKWTISQFNANYHIISAADASYYLRLNNGVWDAHTGGKEDPKFLYKYTTDPGAASTTYTITPECNTYTLTYNGNGATSGSVPAVATEYAAGTSVTVLGNSGELTKTGYDFNGWKADNASSGTAYAAGSSITMSANHTLYAQWLAHTINLTLYANNGGATSDGSASVKYDATALDASPTLVSEPTGKTILGYYAAADGDKKVLNATGTFAGSAVADYITSSKWSRDVTPTELYAHWRDNSYTVVFHKNDASATGTMSDQVFTYGVAQSLTANNFELEEHSFEGWATTSDGEVVYGDEETVNNLTATDGATIDLYAVWSNKIYADYKFTCSDLSLDNAALNKVVWITTIAGQVVRSANPVFKISGSGLKPGAAITFTLGGNSANNTSDIFSFRTKDYSSIAAHAETGALAETEVYAFYNPTATTDGLDLNAVGTQIVATAAGGTSGGKKYMELTSTLANVAINGRHLPTNFVIAGKKDNKWYALPSNMESTSHPAPVEIAVDDLNNPSIAYTVASNKYGMVGPTNSNISGGNGQYIRFTMSINDGNDPAGPAPLFGTNVNDIGKSGPAKATSDLSAGWWWKLQQENTSITNPQDAKYKIYCANNTSTLSIKDNAGNAEWGLYASGVEELRLIPASDIIYTEAYFVEWGEHGGVVEVDATGIDATSVVAHLGEATSSAIPLSQTGTSVKGSATKYNYTVNFGEGIDFAAATSNGALLRLEWKNGDAVKAMTSLVVPKIIASNATMSSLMSGDEVWRTEVHVLPKVTLTADAGSFQSGDVTIKQLEIYPGAIVKVTTGTLDISTLVLRNGWTRVGTKDYNVAQLQIKRGEGGANVTKSNIVDNWYTDWYIDYDQYYPIAVPWNVTVANIKYKNSNSAASAGLKLRYYDGEQRASSGQSQVGQNWKEYSPLPTTLSPSKAYAMTAKRPSGKAFSIIRMPLTFPGAAWTALGEQGEVESTHKNEVTVTGWGYGTSTPWYAKGWNFIGNPYMSIFNGDDDGISGKLELQNGGSIRYATIPDLEFQNYYQVPIAEARINPASGFFIQANKAGEQTVTFAASKIDAPAAAPARFLTQDVTLPEQEAYILLSYEGGKDQMGLIIGDDYTADYEVNADLAKVLGEGNFVKTYMNYGGMDMAYVAINSTLAKEWIPVTVKIPATGEYTFSLTNSSSVEELEGVFLIDYANGSVITNLIGNDYVFTAEEGTITDRFAINATYGGRETPTLIDAVQSGAIDSDKPIKFLFHEKVYILYQGIIYDAVGKKVSEINK